ncbi:MAG: hypothetical protein ACRD96_14155, partial [Bryobacteraceae bacterium]
LGPAALTEFLARDRTGIYFVEPFRRIAYYRFATGLTTPVAELRKGARVVGLALSPDGRWLVYGQLDGVRSDLMVVENFK